MMASSSSSTPSSSSVTPGSSSSSSSSRAEFVAVILAGGEGSRLVPLTDDFPKCLLPVANVPMLYYQLCLLESSGFDRVLVVCTRSQEVHFRRTFSERLNDLVSLDIQLEVVDDGCGSAEALLSVRDLIDRDFLVLGGDLISEVFLHRLADAHRSRRSAVTCLLTSKVPEVISSKTQKNKNVTKDMDEYVGYHPDDAQRIDSIRLRQADSMSDGSGTTLPSSIGLDGGDLVSGLEAENVVFRMLYYNVSSSIDSDEITLTKGFLRDRPRIRFTKNLRSAFCYFFSHWVLRLLDKGDQFLSITEDLIPYLARRQFTPKEILYEKGIPEEAFHNSLSLTYRYSSGEATSVENDVIRCFGFLCPPLQICQRIKTIPVYIRMNQIVARGSASICTPWSAVLKLNYPPLEIEGMHRNISEGCIIGEGVSFDGNATIQKSAIGRFCHIGKNVRIQNSVIMDSVTICDGSTISDCVIASSAYIESKCKLKSCIVGSSSQIPSKTESTGSTYSRNDD